MRILYVCADRGISPCGDKGASAHVRAITAALAARGDSVTVACRRRDGRNAVAAEVRVTLLPEDETGHASWLIERARELEIDVIVERYSLSSGPATVAAREVGCPVLLEVNAPLVEEAARFRGLHDAETWQRREAAVIAAADHVMAVSPAVARHALACGAPAGRISVVANGVDVARFGGIAGDAVRARHHLDGSFVAGFCGSLKPWHGVIDVVDALPLLPPLVKLLIVGDGPERDRIASRCRKLAVDDRVVMTGAVPESDVPAHLAAMDAGVAPYDEMDRFYFSPLKVLEYCAAGLPVVATDQGEMRDLGDAALLVPPRRPAALAAAIALISGDPERRASMSRAARASAAARTWEHTARRIQELAVESRSTPVGGMT